MSANSSFGNKSVIVTGGASGIGEAAALAFARAGAGVTIADIDVEAGLRVVDKIEKLGGKAVFVATDVTSEDAVAHLVAESVAAFGGLDIAFNNAGAPGNFSTAASCTEAEFDRMVALNMRSVYYCMKYEIPEMLKRGGGAILNTSSRAGDTAPRNMFMYSTTKHAVIGMSKSAAVDYATSNIRVNALLPGMTDTPMLGPAAKGAGLGGLGEYIAASVPMARLSTAEEQAEVALWLCSDQASFVTGIAMPVDGGNLAFNH